LSNLKLLVTAVPFLLVSQIPHFLPPWRRVEADVLPLLNCLVFSFSLAMFSSLFFRRIVFLHAGVNTLLFSQHVSFSAILTTKADNPCAAFLFSSPPSLDWD